MLLMFLTEFCYILTVGLTSKIVFFMLKEIMLLNIIKMDSYKFFVTRDKMHN